MTNWKTVRGDVKPAVIDTTTSSFVVYERRNIHTEEVSDGNDEGGTRTMWVYDEREYGKDEYAAMTAPATAAIMQGISDLELSVAMLG